MENTGDRQDILGLDRVLEYIPVSKQVLRREIGRGKLMAHKFGGRLYVFRKDLDDYIKATQVVE